MPADKDKIKKSLDDFENSNYVDSEEELKDQVRKSVKGHLRNKLGLKNNPDGTEPEEEEEESESGEEPKKENEPENSENPNDGSNNEDGSKE